MDDASLWWYNRHSQVQDYNIPEENDDFDSFTSDEPHIEEDPVTKQDVSSQINMIALQQPTAKLLTGCMDVLLPLLLIFIFKDVDKEEFKLDNEERDMLVDAWANYLKDTDFAMSPAGVLITTILTIYGGKVTVVMWKRKQKSDEMELIREQNRLLKEQNQKIAKEQEAKNERTTKNESNKEGGA